MTSLADMIAAEAARRTFPAADAFAQHLVTQYGPSTAAVVFYGSCLRTGSDQGGMLDFYVLVDRMGDAIKHPLSALAGAVLPPNVYYRELPFEGRVLRAKVAVMTMAAFIVGASPGLWASKIWASTIWARFAQPSAILYARNDIIRGRVVAALADAVKVMIAAAVPLMPDTFSARDLWVRALQETYGAELRPESPAKAAELVDADAARYGVVTDAVLGQPVDGRHKRVTATTAAAARMHWRLRRVVGKSLNVLRLIKAAFTFQGGLDYAVWKIERHSGAKIELTDADRRRPLVTGIKLLARTWRKGGV